MARIAFNRTLDFEYGRADQVSPLIRRVVARNPGPFTFHGTGTYIIGEGRVAVVDPGPALDDHVAALLDALDGQEVSHILVTHTHNDHSPASRPLQDALAARGSRPPIYGHGPHGAGKIERGAKVEEGGDMSFTPDETLRHGDLVEGEGWTVECLHTPGHTSNHLCFALNEEAALFTGDHVMGWSTSVISPPDGDMADYLASLDMLLERDDTVYWPTHGDAVREPRPYVESFIAHRRDRERQILTCIADGIDTITAMVPIIYRDLPRAMYPAAARSVFAHVIHLVEQGRLAHDGPLAVSARYRAP